MHYLTKTIRSKTIYLKSYHKGEIVTTEDKSEALTFNSKDEANAYAKQSIGTLTWRATANEGL
jgi:hypothetical protein